MNAFRERDVRAQMAATLDATGLFDVMPATDAEGSEPAEAGSAYVITPALGAVEADWDSQLSGSLYVDATVRVTVIARDPDTATRDARAELLLMVACNALNGNAFGGMACPAWSKVVSWKWLKPSPPARAIEATFMFRYLVDSWTGFNTSE